MPPPDLAMAVAGTAGQRWFSEQGRGDAAKFIGLARPTMGRTSDPAH
jgi:hypothetical protein